MPLKKLHPIKRMRQLTFNVDQIADTLINLRSWLVVMQTQQEQLLRWYRGTSEFDYSLFEGHDMAVARGELPPLVHRLCGEQIEPFTVHVCPGESWRRRAWKKTLRLTVKLAAWAQQKASAQIA